MANSPARFQVRFEVDGDGNVRAAMDGITAKARDVSSAAGDVSKRWYEASISLSSALKVGAVAFGGISGAFALVIKNSIDAQNEMAQLNAVLQSSGQAANFSGQQIADMADNIAKASTFSGGDVTNAATRLLSYSGIVTEKFAPALQVAIDQAARLGISVEQSAETVGRALESPTKAAAALAQQGFGAAFTKEVRNGIAALVDAGKEAEAQQVIIDILNDSYGGAAAAARDTLGGAFKALKNTAFDLLEGDSQGEGLKGVRQAIEDLIATLHDPDVQSGFQALVEGLLNTASAAAQAVSGISKMIATALQVTKLGDGRLAPKDATTDALQLRLSTVTDLRARTQQQRTTFLGFDIDSLDQQRKQSLTNYDNEIAALQAELATRKIPVLINEGNAGDPQPSLRPVATRQPIPNAEDPAARNKRLAEEEREARKLQNAYDRLMQSYGEQIAVGQQVTEVAKVRYATEQGDLKNLTEQQKAALVAKASYIDQMEQEYALQQRLQELDDRRSLVLDDLQSERAALGLSNDELEIRANLLRAGVSRESDWGKTIAENTRKLQQERRTTHDQIDAMDSVRDAGKDLFMGAATSADSFGDVAINALERLRNRMLEMAAERLMDQIFGVYGTTQTGSAGGWMASLGGWVGSLFGGNTATATAQATGNYGAFNPNMPGFGGGKATGGAIRAGSIYEVTEGGAPELLRQNGRTYLLPGADGTVIPARYAAGGGAAGGAAGQAPIVNLTINQGAREDRQEVSSDALGNFDIRVWLKSEVNNVIRSGAADASMASAYGLARKGVRRG